jgi:CheY-like chemotaxis protein
MRNLLAGPSGTRGDAAGDKMYGGYNIRFPIIVCDILVPGGPPTTDDIWRIKGLQSSQELRKQQKEQKPKEKEAAKKPTLLFFGPPTDTPAVTRLVPLLAEHYEVIHFDDASEAITEIQNRDTNFSACVAKLGSKGNMGTDVVKALRERKNGEKTFVVIHSATAMQSERTRKHLQPMVDLICDHDSEAEMLQILRK